MARRARPILNADGTAWDITDALKPELDHVVCCNPGKALCGAWVAGTAVAFGSPAASKNPCQKCFNLAADGAKCDAPMCPGDDQPV